MIVVDASVAVSWFLSDELDNFASASAQRVLEETAIVPAIFPTEVANALVVASRRGRMSASDVRERVRRLHLLPIVIEASHLNTEDEANLALKHGLTVHDAAYLSVAKRQRGLLLTRDVHLAEAARSEKIRVEGDAHA